MAVVIEARNIRKSYGHVEAIRGASLQLHGGEVLALVGDNGAGKSSFMKVLAGMVTPDEGELSFMGEVHPVTSVRDVQNLGLEIVYQDLAVCPDLSVIDNMFLGRETLTGGWRRWFRFVDRGAMGAKAQIALDQVGTTIKSLNQPVRDLSGGQRQAVAIARAVMWATTAILMDEPTAALGTKQTDRTNELIRRAAERGLGVLVVSHDIPNMLEVADRMAIMRHGVVIESRPTSELSVEEVVTLMLGGASTAPIASSTATPIGATK
jgi:simple sugar transport system ATP-binding protein